MVSGPARVIICNLYVVETDHGHVFRDAQPRFSNCFHCTQGAQIVLAEYGRRTSIALKQRSCGIIAAITRACRPIPFSKHQVIVKRNPKLLQSLTVTIESLSYSGSGFPVYDCPDSPMSQTQKVFCRYVAAELRSTVT